MSKTFPSIFNIPSGVPFARSLAHALIDEYHGNMDALGNVKIFLPTRRGCRTLATAFLELSENKALILPHMHAIGNVDEEALSLSQFAEQNQADILAIPPAISPLKRQILLGRMIHAMDQYNQNFDHALVLAKALGQFIDHIYTEDLSLSHLYDLVPEDFAQHWQITLDFLKIISEHWPKILQENNVIDAADRRNRLIKALTQHWTDFPPKERIIAAGSTGSIPSTATFLSFIAHKDQGSIVLPGLDQEMDDDSWESLTETHPQHSLRKLLQQMNVARHDVQPWPCPHDSCADKRFVAGEIMRPPATTKQWGALSQSEAKARILNVIENTPVITCKSPHEEAHTIAIMIREAIETPDKSIALITPDRELAKRVQTLCRRWNINIDDSAGYSLGQSALGQYFALLLHVCMKNFSPVVLSALLKQAYFKAQPHNDSLYALEIHALRGMKPENGLSDLKKRLMASDGDFQTSIDFLSKLDEHFQPLTSLLRDKHHFKTFLQAHIGVAERLASTSGEEDEPTPLWRGDEGAAASEILSELLEETHEMPQLDFASYVNVFTHFVQAQLVRPKFGTHPRAHILGQLEARLIEADTIIMASLNEGKWPREAPHDPWMSRNMQSKFGLPHAERNIGLSAHDFVQGFCAQNVIITRAQTDGKDPTLPSRWLQRLDKVMEAADIDQSTISPPPYLSWARHIDQAESYQPTERPAPKPAQKYRPRSLSATRIETWIRDPYSIYASHILKLKPLDDMEKPLDAAARGTLIHDVFHQFVQKYGAQLPANAEAELHELLRDILNDLYDNPSEWESWLPRMDMMVQQFLDMDKDWRKCAVPIKTEIRGTMKMHTNGHAFELSAKADRIDLVKERGLCIIDYKSSAQFTRKSVIEGQKPQLAIEALIASEHGYPDINEREIAAMQYWLLPGSYDSAKIVDISEGIDEILQRTKAGIHALVEVFDDPETPYYSLPDPSFAPAYNDYEHLSRVSEWSILDQDQEAA